MKVSKEQQRRNRTAIVTAAARLFRRDGIDGVGVKEICSEAGLTHGALYAHFANKEALAIEEFDSGFDAIEQHLRDAASSSQDIASAFLEVYLNSREPVVDPENACPIVASACEHGRQGRDMSARLLNAQQTLAELLSDPRNRGNVSPALADLMLAAAVGAAAISFGIRKTSNAHAVAFSFGIRHTIDQLIEHERHYARHESDLPGADGLAEWLRQPSRGNRGESEP